MAKTYNTTATYAWGTLDITFGTGSQNGNLFITDQFETTEGTWIAERNDNVGNPNGALGGVLPVTGRAVLQIANNTVRYPERYDEFTCTRRPGQSNVFFLTSIGTPKEGRQFDTCPIEFREKI